MQVLNTVSASRFLRVWKRQRAVVAKIALLISVSFSLNNASRPQENKGPRFLEVASVWLNQKALAQSDATEERRFVYGQRKPP